MSTDCSSYATVLALEREHNNLNIKACPNLQGELIITPKDSTAACILKNRPELQELDPADRQRKAYILFYPDCLPL